LRGQIVVVPYDPEWPRYFEDERKLILGCIGHLIRSIEHIGSTSVPNLLAKPIVDIIVGVDNLEAADKCVGLLHSIGYDDVTPEKDQDWFYCLGKGHHSPGFHLHIVREGSAHHLKHIIFRNWLRSHPEDVEDYKELKLDLSGRFRNDRVNYTDSKSDFINAVVKKAKKNY
jgi:GrpB-like predicted nucleotidyltransferase (UPF0157 family)